MKTYTVKYKLKGQWFFRTLKRIAGDLVDHQMPTAPRALFTDKDERIEIPTEGTIFRFSRERYEIIDETMKKESGGAKR